MALLIPTGSRIARIGAIVLALLVLVFVLRTGLAFALARSNPPLAVRIDTGNAAALAALSDRLLTTAQDDADVAEVDRVARAAVTASPLESKALRTVGFIMSVTGKDAPANRTIALAADASLRDPFAHAWLLEQHFRENRVVEAVTEADIVLRQRTATWPVVMPALAKLIGDTRVIEPLAKRLATRPYWRSSFLEALGTHGDDPAASFALLRYLAGLGAPASTAELRTYFLSLDRADPAIVHRRWTALLAAPLPPRHKLLRDGGFAGLDAPPPFNWMFYPRDSVYAEISDGPEGSGPALYLSFDGTAAVTFAAQRLILPPGSYRLTGRGFAEGEVRDDQFAVSVRCSEAEGGREFRNVPLRLKPDVWTKIGFTFQVPADCVAQNLQFSGAPNDALDPATIWIDDLAITRERAAR